MTTDQEHDSDHESRGASRVTLPAMYTVVRVRPRGGQRYRWTGFAYDISTCGMRFELDESIPQGTDLDVRVMLPGSAPTHIHLTGQVVRMHDDPDEPGPVRMGMRFDDFRNTTDRERLNGYLADHLLQAAA
jgi:hypothetical protein